MTLGHYLNGLSWRWLAAAGLALGFGAGLSGFLALESPWWLPALGVLFAGLTWLGWDAEPRLAEPLVHRPVPKNSLAPRLVRDGPFAMAELPGGEFLMGSPDSDDMAHGDEKPQRLVRISGVFGPNRQKSALAIGGRVEPGDLL